MLKATAIFLITLASFFICEQIIFIPIIIFCYLLTYSNILEVCKRIQPTFYALLTYLVYFTFSHSHSNFTNSSYTFDRIWWIAPQIFVHVINLILLPVHLTIDQTSLINFTPYYLHPFAFFCFLTFAATIIITLCSFKYDKDLFVTLSGFLIALLPFLQIITPTYCLMSERYLYMPLFFLILGIGYCLQEKNG